MKLTTQPYKGTRDFYPEDMRLRNWMFSVMRQVCESYGYEEYDGPVLEPLEIYTAKTSEEIVNEQSFSFTDRGDRKVIMRPEMTPTVSRMVAARRQELGYPLRLYSIPNFFRYERPQKGRLREFWQLNADIFGVEGIEADVEIIRLADAIMKAYGSKEGSYEIRVNSRNFLSWRISLLKPQVPEVEILRVLDNWSKDPEGTKSKIRELVARKDYVDSGFLNGVMELDLEEDSKKNSIFMEKMNELIDRLNLKSVAYDPSLVRGFDYYTDIVFEVFDTNPENNRSMFGGGRYDGLVSEFGVEPVPTVGFGMGDVTLENFLESNNLIPELKPSTDLVVIGIDVSAENLDQLSSELRKNGVNVAVDYTDRKLDKRIKAAEKLGVQNVVFIGDNELKSGKYKLKNLQSGEENEYSLEQLTSKLNETK